MEHGADVGTRICTAAKEQNGTLIVLGSRGAGAVRRTILGSVSDYVIHHTEVPVLLCPKPHVPRTKSANFMKKIGKSDKI